MRILLFGAEAAAEPCVKERGCYGQKAYYGAGDNAIEVLLEAPEIPDDALGDAQAKQDKSGFAVDGLVEPKAEDDPDKRGHDNGAGEIEELEIWQDAQSHYSHCQCTYG